MVSSNKKLSELLKIVKFGKGLEREKATKEFLIHYHHIIKGLFYGYFKMISREDVEDLSQELLTRLLKKNININGNFRGYLFYAARNLFLNHKNLKENSIVFDEDLSNVPSRYLEDHPDIIVDYNIKKEIFYRNHKNKRNSSVQNQFKSMLLKVPYKKIAKEHGICDGAVKKNIHRVRNLEGEIFFEEPRSEPYQV